MRKAVLVVCVLLLVSCSTIADEPGDDEAGEPDGLFVHCGNPEGLNWYWLLVACDGAPDCMEPKKITKMPSVCIGPGNIDSEFDAVHDAVFSEEASAYHFPSWDAEIDKACAAACVTKNDENTNATPICIPENFTGQHFTSSVWTPQTSPNCDSSMPWGPLVSDPAHASEIDWNEGIGSPLSLPLSCSLLDDCHEQFDADISDWVLWWEVGGMLAPIDPDSRAAAYSSSTEATLSLDMDAQPLFGGAEYTAADCGEETCPFYLARFDARSGESRWSIRLDIPGLVNEPKWVDGVELDALHSTMGIWRPETGRVAFLPGTLRLQVAFDITRECRECTGFGDGSYRYELVNPEVVFGTLNPKDGSFRFDYAFRVPGGEATLQARFEADEHPPRAAFDLEEILQCNAADGYVLSADDNTSTDPDFDIEHHLWYVDGVPRNNGFAIPVGLHDVELLVVDSRGAHSHAGERTLEVTVGPACL